MKKHLVAGVLAGMLSAGQAVCTETLSGTIFEKVGEELSLDPVLLYAVSLCESGFKAAGDDKRRPWPWTLRYPGGALYAASKKDAELELLRLKQLGVTPVDVGLMQINLRWHRDRIRDADILDPATNLRFGARILKEALNSSPENLALGIARFHSWTDAERQRNYSKRVLRTYRRLKDL